MNGTFFLFQELSDQLWNERVCTLRNSMNPDSYKVNSLRTLWLLQCERSSWIHVMKSWMKFNMLIWLALFRLIEPSGSWEFHGLVGLRNDSEISQNFRIFAKFLGHRVWHLKLCLPPRFATAEKMHWRFRNLRLGQVHHEMVFFSKTFCTIVISVQRSTSSPSAMKKLLRILVFFVSWNSAILKIRNHRILNNWEYKSRIQNI